MATTLNETAYTIDGNVVTYTRLFNAPRELVWKVWTEPEHIKHWWGPNGFTNTIQHMNVAPNGEWNFIMHGPDGIDYPNRVVFKQVVKNELLVYSHGGDANGEEVDFKVEVRFEDENGKTKLTMKSVFASPEVLQHLIKKVGALEGGKQTLARCADYLSQTFKN